MAQVSGIRISHLRASNPRKLPVRKSEGSNPSVVNYFAFFYLRHLKMDYFDAFEALKKVVWLW